MAECERCADFGVAFSLVKWLSTENAYFSASAKEFDNERPARYYWSSLKAALLNAGFQIRDGIWEYGIDPALRS